MGTTRVKERKSGREVFEQDPYHLSQSIAAAEGIEFVPLVLTEAAVVEYLFGYGDGTVSVHQIEEAVVEELGTPQEVSGDADDVSEAIASLIGAGFLELDDAGDIDLGRPCFRELKQRFVA